MADFDILEPLKALDVVAPMIRDVRDWILALQQKEYDKKTLTYLENRQLKGRPFIGDFSNEPTQIIHIKNLSNALYLAEKVFEQLPTLDLSSSASLNGIYDIRDQADTASVLLLQIGSEFEGSFKQEIANIASCLSQVGSFTSLINLATASADIQQNAISLNAGRMIGHVIDQMKPATGKLNCNLLTWFSSALPTYIETARVSIETTAANASISLPNVDNEKIAAVVDKKLDKVSHSIKNILSTLGNINDPISLITNLPGLFRLPAHFKEMQPVLTEIQQEVEHLDDTIQQFVHQCLAQLKYELLPNLFALVDKFEIQMLLKTEPNKPGRLSGPLMDQIKPLYEMLIQTSKQYLNVKFIGNAEQLLKLEDARFIELRLDPIYQQVNALKTRLHHAELTEQMKADLLFKLERNNDLIDSVHTTANRVLFEHKDTYDILKLSEQEAFVHRHILSDGIQFDSNGIIKNPEKLTGNEAWDVYQWYDNKLANLTRAEGECDHLFKALKSSQVRNKTTAIAFPFDYIPCLLEGKNVQHQPNRLYSTIEGTTLKYEVMEPLVSTSFSLLNMTQDNPQTLTTTEMSSRLGNHDGFIRHDEKIYYFDTISLNPLPQESLLLLKPLMDKLSPEKLRVVDPDEPDFKTINDKDIRARCKLYLMHLDEAKEAGYRNCYVWNSEIKQLSYIDPNGHVQDKIILSAKNKSMLILFIEKKNIHVIKKIDRWRLAKKEVPTVQTIHQADLNQVYKAGHKNCYIWNCEENPKCSLIQISIDPEKMTNDELRVLLNNKSSYVLFNSKIYYIDKNLKKTVFPGKDLVFSETDIDKLKSIFSHAINKLQDASHDDLLNITVLTGHTQYQLTYLDESDRCKQMDLSKYKYEIKDYFRNGYALDTMLMSKSSECTIDNLEKLGINARKPTLIKRDKEYWIYGRSENNVWTLVKLTDPGTEITRWLNTIDFSAKQTIDAPKSSTLNQYITAINGHTQITLNHLVKLVDHKRRANLLSKTKTNPKTDDINYVNLTAGQLNGFIKHVRCGLVWMAAEPTEENLKMSTLRSCYIRTTDGLSYFNKEEGILHKIALDSNQSNDFNRAFTENQGIDKLSSSQLERITSITGHIPSSGSHHPGVIKTGTIPLNELGCNLTTLTSITPLRSFIPRIVDKAIEQGHLHNNDESQCIRSYSFIQPYLIDAYKNDPRKKIHEVDQKAVDLLSGLVYKDNVKQPNMTLDEFKSKLHDLALHLSKEKTVLKKKQTEYLKLAKTKPFIAETLPIKTIYHQEFSPDVAKFMLSIDPIKRQIDESSKTLFRVKLAQEHLKKYTKEKRSHTQPGFDMSSEHYPWLHAWLTQLIKNKQDTQSISSITAEQLKTHLKQIQFYEETDIKRNQLIIESVNNKNNPIEKHDLSEATAFMHLIHNRHEFKPCMMTDKDELEPGQLHLEIKDEQLHYKFLHYGKPLIGKMTLKILGSLSHFDEKTALSKQLVSKILSLAYDQRKKQILVDKALISADEALDLFQWYQSIHVAPEEQASLQEKLDFYEHKATAIPPVVKIEPEEAIKPMQRDDRTHYLIKHKRCEAALTTLKESIKLHFNDLTDSFKQELQPASSEIQFSSAYLPKPVTDWLLKKIPSEMLTSIYSKVPFLDTGIPSPASYWVPKVAPPLIESSALDYLIKNLHFLSWVPGYSSGKQRLNKMIASMQPTIKPHSPRQVLAYKRVINIVYYLEQIMHEMQKIQETTDNESKLSRVNHLLISYLYAAEIYPLITELSTDPHFSPFFQDILSQVNAVIKTITDEKEHYSPLEQDAKSVNNVHLLTVMNILKMLPERLSSTSEAYKAKRPALKASALKTTANIEKIINDYHASFPYVRLFFNLPMIVNLLDELRKEAANLVQKTNKRIKDDLEIAPPEIISKIRMAADTWETTIGLKPGTLSEPLNKILDEFYKGLITPLVSDPYTRVRLLCDPAPIKQRQANTSNQLSMAKRDLNSHNQDSKAMRELLHACDNVIDNSKNRFLEANHSLDYCLAELNDAYKAALPLFKKTLSGSNLYMMPLSEAKEKGLNDCFVWDGKSQLFHIDSNGQPQPIQLKSIYRFIECITNKMTGKKLSETPCLYLSENEIKHFITSNSHFTMQKRGVSLPDEVGCCLISMPTVPTQFEYLKLPSNYNAYYVQVKGINDTLYFIDRNTKSITPLSIHKHKQNQFEKIISTIKKNKLLLKKDLNAIQTLIEKEVYQPNFISNLDEFVPDIHNVNQLKALATKCEYEHVELSATAQLTINASQEQLNFLYSVEKEQKAAKKTIKKSVFDEYFDKKTEELCNKKTILHGYTLSLLTKFVKIEPNHIYINIKGGSLDYKVIDPAGREQTGSIELKALGYTSEKTPLVDDLRPYLPAILNITSKQSERHTRSHSLAFDYQEKLRAALLTDKEMIINTALKSNAKSIGPALERRKHAFNKKHHKEYLKLNALNNALDEFMLYLNTAEKQWVARRSWFENDDTIQSKRSTIEHLDALAANNACDVSERIKKIRSYLLKDSTLDHLTSYANYEKNCFATLVQFVLRLFEALGLYTPPVIQRVDKLLRTIEESKDALPHQSNGFLFFAKPMKNKIKARANELKAKMDKKDEPDTSEVDSKRPK